MKGGTILLIVGLVLGYMAITGYYKCFTLFGKCLAYGPEPCSCGAPTASAQDSSAVPAPNKPVTYEAPPYEGPGPVTLIPNLSLDAFA